ncbi:MAG TPA: hypothetical protein PKA64_07050, partial [Myxococcota bacterium]|nr:hypothetical protein [Myxococcota bacterium]
MIEQARAWLQPALAPLVDRALALTGETVRPLALSPWRGLMEWSLGGALMALAAGVASRTREVEARRRLLLWLVGSGLAVLFVAWVHRAQGAPSIWWVTGVPAYKREPFFAPFASANHAGALLAALVPLAGGLALAGPLHSRRFGAGAL